MLFWPQKMTVWGQPPDNKRDMTIRESFGYMDTKDWAWLVGLTAAGTFLGLAGAHQRPALPLVPRSVNIVTGFLLGITSGYCVAATGANYKYQHGDQKQNNPYLGE